MTWKSYAMVSGAGVVATWLVSPPLPRTEDVAPQRTRSPRIERVSDIEQQAVRLQTGLRRQAPYQQPSRNPFRFTERRRQSAAERIEPVAAAPVVAPAVPPPAPIVLVGIAEDEAAGRTAILKTPDGMVFVRTGDAVGAEYTVRAIDGQAIDLVGADGAVRRITPAP